MASSLGQCHVKWYMVTDILKDCSDPEDEDITILQNISNWPPTDTVLTYQRTWILGNETQ